MPLLLLLRKSFPPIYLCLKSTKLNCKYITSDFKLNSINFSVPTRFIHFLSFTIFHLHGDPQTVSSSRSNVTMFNKYWSCCHVRITYTFSYGGLSINDVKQVFFSIFLHHPPIVTPHYTLILRLFTVVTKFLTLPP
jgi:hypothetical protein